MPTPKELLSMNAMKFVIEVHRSAKNVADHMDID